MAHIEEGNQVCDPKCKIINIKQQLKINIDDILQRLIHYLTIVLA
jgi:predicted nucleic acid-binding Zn ribbon protein